MLYGFAMVMIAWTFLLHSQPTALPDTTPDKVREAEWETNAAPCLDISEKQTAFLGVSKDGKIWVDVLTASPASGVIRLPDGNYRWRVCVTPK